MSHPILQFFEYDHLSEAMQQVSRPFCDLANIMHTRLPNNAETTTCLRKLLEAKDCAVRASIAKEQGKPESYKTPFLR
jgi:ferritin-like protein